MTQVEPTTSRALDGDGGLDRPRVKRPFSTWAIAIGAGLLFTLVVLAAITQWMFGRATPSGGIGTIVWLIQSCGLWGPMFLILALIAAMWACAPIRTIARQTFVQCLRMRVAAVVLLLLGIALVLDQFVTGDGTLAGRIRTFLAYTTTHTAIALTVVSVLMSVRLISADVQTKQIFTIMTKPIARWQYVLGRWLGLVTLNAVLLVAAGAAIYGSAQYLRGLEAKSAEDLRAVETEVFSARQKINAQPMDISEQLVKRLTATRELTDARDKVRKHERLKTDDDAIRELAKYATGEASFPPGLLSPDESQLLLRTREDIIKSVQSAAPGGTLFWDFAGIAVAGTNYEGRAKVVAIDKAKGLLLIEAPPQLLGKLSRLGPITVDSTVGTVLEVQTSKREESGRLTADFAADEFERGKFASIKPGDEVSVIAEPVIQLQYKGSAANLPILTGLWTVGPKEGGVRFGVPRSDPNNASSTLTVPARAVDKNGHTTVTYTNLPGNDGRAQSVTILQEDVSILCKVGDFELPLPGVSIKIDAFTCNFIRGFFLILFQLMFICGVGTLAGSFLSFAVGSLASFVFLIIGLGREFLANAMNSVSSQDISLRLSAGLFWCVQLIIPDLSRTSPSDALVDGLHIPWVVVASVAALTAGLATLLVVTVACVIFRSRELARVQV